MAERERESFNLPVNWKPPEEAGCEYTTNLIVQHTDHEFIISFYRAYPPLVLGTIDQVKLKLQEIEAVDAECVARVIVAASRMPEFVEVLTRNLDAYQSRIVEKDEEEE